MRYLRPRKVPIELQIGAVFPVLAHLLAIAALRGAFYSIRTNTRKSTIDFQ